MRRLFPCDELPSRKGMPSQPGSLAASGHAAMLWSEATSSDGRRRLGAERAAVAVGAARRDSGREDVDHNWRHTFAGGAAQRVRGGRRALALRTLAAGVPIHRGGGYEANATGTMAPIPTPGAATSTGALARRDVTGAKVGLAAKRRPSVYRDARATEGPGCVFSDLALWFRHVVGDLFCLRRSGRTVFGEVCGPLPAHRGL